MEPKKRVIKDYTKLPEDVLNQIKIKYPRGFVKHLIKYTNKDGVFVSALPYEADEANYLVRMSIAEARQIISDDDDYDDDGILRDDFEEDIEEADFDEEVDNDEDDD